MDSLIERVTGGGVPTPPDAFFSYAKHQINSIKDGVTTMASDKQALSFEKQSLEEENKRLKLNNLTIQTQQMETLAENSRLMDQVSHLEKEHSKAWRERTTQLWEARAELNKLQKQLACAKLDVEELIIIWDDTIASVEEVLLAEVQKVQMAFKHDRNVIIALRDRITKLCDDSDELYYRNLTLEQNVMFQIEMNSKLQVVFEGVKNYLENRGNERINLSLSIKELEINVKKCLDKIKDDEHKRAYTYGKIEEENRILIGKSGKDLTDLVLTLKKLQENIDEMTLIILTKDEFIDSQNAELLSSKQLVQELYRILETHKEQVRDLKEQLEQQIEEQVLESLAQEFLRFEIGNSNEPSSDMDDADVSDEDLLLGKMKSVNNPSLFGSTGKWSAKTLVGGKWVAMAVVIGAVGLSVFTVGYRPDKFTSVYGTREVCNPLETVDFLMTTELPPF